MQSNVDLCPRCSRSNSYRPPLLRLPIPRAALYFTRAHQPNKYYVFPLYPTRVPDQITRRILQTLDARSRNSAARDHVSEVGRFHMERLQGFYCGQSRRNFRGISIGNCGTLFEKRFVFRYSTACRELNCKINILENWIYTYCYKNAR